MYVKMLLKLEIAVTFYIAVVIGTCLYLNIFLENAVLPKAVNQPSLFTSKPSFSFLKKYYCHYFNGKIHSEEVSNL